jgi:plasmid stability protein
VKTLYVRNVPDDVDRALAERAAREGTTMSALARGELPRLVRRPSMEEVQARILSRSPVGGPPAAELIREARAERTEGD